MLSEASQRSSRLPDGASSVPPESYRTTIPRALTPEQLLASVLRATGNRQRVRAMKAPADVKFDRRGYFTGTNKELPRS